jgi:hypothetical protein
MTSHLHNSVQPLMDRPLDERIRFCRNTSPWITYSRAHDILLQVEDYLNYPRMDRMPSMLIIGSSANGKSALLRQIELRHPPREGEDGTTVMPVVRVRLPSNVTDSSFLTTILNRLRIAHRDRDSPMAKRRMVMTALAELKTRLIAVDEFNHIGWSLKASTAILNCLKDLSSSLDVSIVAAGTHLAVNPMAFEQQMRTRYAPMDLPEWTVDAEYRRFLSTLEQLIPLPEPSDLGSKAMASLIHQQAGPAIGMTVMTIREATVVALQAGARHLTAEIIQSPKVRQFVGVWSG